MNRLFTTLAALGLGASFMYFYDPDRGRRRRALVRDQATSMRANMDDAIEVGVRDLRNRVRGLLAEGMARLSDQSAPDWILEERVRAELGRFSRHSGAIEVSAGEGHITLKGPVLRDEAERLVQATAAVRGVSGVTNALEVHDEPGDVPGLQASPGRREPGTEMRQENWSPSARLLTGVGGGVLALYGASRRGLIGTAASLAGLGLAARGVTNTNLKRLLGMGEGRRSIDIHKSINVDIPTEQAYRFWSRFENFPRFMAHVREVSDSGNGRSHWVVAGPAGAPVEFDAIITRQVPNQIIAWKTLPEQAVEHTGVVRFDPNPDGSTRISVRMRYSPPAGAIGHAVASFFGADPKHAMDKDLARLKTLLEVGKTSAEGRDVTRQELSGATG
jgi:uncharacterized membrane protein